MGINMLKGVIFDMDGVLVNSEPMHYKACCKLMEEHNNTINFDYYEKFIGSTLTHLTESLVKDYELPITPDEVAAGIQKNREYYIKRDGFEIIVGVSALLYSLRKANIKMAVASSSPQNYIVRVIKALGIDHYFEKLISGENVENPKPAPDIFRKAMEELGLNKEECLVVEDSMNGVLAAKHAGIPAIGFENKDSGEQDLSEACIIVQGFEGIDDSFMEMVYLRSHGLPLIVGKTQRLLLREMIIRDMDRFYDWYKNEEFSKYLENEDRTLEEEIENLQGYIQNIYPLLGFGYWSIILQETNELIGRAGLNIVECDGDTVVELGYMIGPEYQNKGYAYEACVEILDYAKNVLDMNTVYILVKEENLISRKLSEKLGFQLVGEGNVRREKLLKYEKMI